MIMIKLMEEDGVSDPISASGTNDLINMMPLHRVVCSFKREEIHLKYRVHVPPNVHIRSRFSPSKFRVLCSTSKTVDITMPSIAIKKISACESPDIVLVISITKGRRSSEEAQR